MFLIILLRHIAATLKRIITILLLLLMVGQITGTFSAKSTEIKLVQDLEEKKDNSGKKDKKESKDYDSDIFSFTNLLENKADIHSALVAATVSPVLEHLTPPPDGLSHS